MQKLWMWIKKYNINTIAGWSLTFILLSIIAYFGICKKDWIPIAICVGILILLLLKDKINRFSICGIEAELTKKIEDARHILKDIANVVDKLTISTLVSFQRHDELVDCHFHKDMYDLIISMDELRRLSNLPEFQIDNKIYYERRNIAVGRMIEAFVDYILLNKYKNPSEYLKITNDFKQLKVCVQQINEQETQENLLQVIEDKANTLGPDAVNQLKEYVNMLQYPYT